MSAEEACRILLVEDDSGIGGMLERGLAASGYRVEWVRKLADAVGKARQIEHDLIVLDRNLPDGDGADLCAALRRYGHPAPVLMLTARDALEDKLKGFDAGADDYLTKPFEFDELLARLSVLRRRAVDARPALRLDASARSLVLGPRRSKLTAREWAVMEHLHTNADRLVSREELIGAVWGDGEGVTSNSVDVYVGYLRRKLTEIGASERIETVRGLGFQLSC